MEKTNLLEHFGRNRNFTKLWKNQLFYQKTNKPNFKTFFKHGFIVVNVKLLLATRVPHIGGCIG